MTLQNHVTCLIGALSLLTAPLAAQSPAERARVAAFRDSISSVTDSAALHRLADSLEQAAGQRAAAAPLLALESGFALLRMGEMGNHWRLADAADRFDEVRDRRTDWPYPYLGAALADWGSAAWQTANPLTIGTRAGMGLMKAGVKRLAEAVHLDHAFVPALEALAQTPTLVRDTTLWRTALAALRSAAPAGRTPAVLLGRGRLERELGDPDRALQDFESFLAHGGEPGIGRLEWARTAFLLHRPGADSAYYAGALSDDSASVAEYRRDLTYLVGDSALAGFDAARGEARADWLRRFWQDRAAADLRRPGERLAEHIRRYFYARAHYAPPQTRRVYWAFDAYRSGNPDFDDRGIIYLRHGEPSVVVHGVDAHAKANESWRYFRPDGDLIFHFLAEHGSENYLLQASLGVLALKVATEAGSDRVFASRAVIDPIYGKLLSWGPYGVRGALRADALAANASIDWGTTHDSYQLRFAEPLPAAIQLDALGSRDGQPLLHAVFAIPGSRARGTKVGSEWYYPVRLRLAVLDSASHPVASVDSSFTLTSAQPADSGRYLFGRVAVPVPAGRWRYRLALQQGDSAGVVLPTDSLIVARFDTTGPALSDLVIGWHQIPLTWARTAEDTVYFSPFRGYFNDTELELYYEVYGLPAGSSYRTEIAVTRQGGGGLFHGAPRATRLLSEDRVYDRIVRGRRTIQLRSLDPGDYWLDVTITDAAGRQTHRRTEFAVERRPR